MEKTNKITINGITVPDGTDVNTAVENGNLVITFSKESEVEKYLKTIDPMALSPLDALSTLIELKKLLK